MPSDNNYFCPNYPIKLKTSMFANEKLGMRKKETFVA
jgi:hypothetical protein